jgi:putative addiction module component (TIGR02574 family)
MTPIRWTAILEKRITTMNSNLEAVFAAALALPPASRAVLAEKLVKSLDDHDQAGIEAAWVEEVERRLQAFDRGTLKAIPGDEVRAG